MTSKGKVTRIDDMRGVGRAAWQFFKDHPFKNAKPYAKGLEAASTFPDYCRIVCYE